MSGMACSSYGELATKFAKLDRHVSYRAFLRCRLARAIYTCYAIDNRLCLRIDTNLLVSAIATKALLTPTQHGGGSKLSLTPMH